MNFHHITVLKEETVNGLDVKPGGIYVDMTLGGGGHSEEIIKRGGRVIGIDRDINAIEAASRRLAVAGDNFRAVKGNFRDVKSILEGLGIDSIDGVVMDLGVSSPQLDEAERGFSYMQDAPLDMRMDRDEEFSAYDVINGYDEARLMRVISDYGEERWAKRIASFIVKAREREEIKTTGELVDIIKAAIPKAARAEGHPAKRTFQAVRIEVNGELRILEDAAADAVDMLKKGGRISVITFHSLEDRIIKNLFVKLKNSCTCPKDFPVCVCGGEQKIKIITSKPVVADRNELEENSRAKSAKLRIAERV